MNLFSVHPAPFICPRNLYRCRVVQQRRHEARIFPWGAHHVSGGKMHEHRNHGVKVLLTGDTAW